MEKQDKISKEKINKYMKVTTKALGLVKDNIIEGKESKAEEIINMVENYISDAKHFLAGGNYINSFAALNYAHGWLDCGVRTGIFNVKNDKLFTVK